MTVLTEPNVQLDTTDTKPDPINLYKLGMLFVVKCSYWSCRAGNDSNEWDLTQEVIQARALGQ